jgi:6-phosphogluconolactonase
MARWAVLITAAAVLAGGWPAAAGEQSMTVYVGTYSQRGSRGIYVLKLDGATGTLTDTGLAQAAHNPSYLAVHPGGKFLYCVNEDGGKAHGGVTAFAIDPDTGGLSELNRVSSEGDGPCYVSLDATGRQALVANYGSGHVAALPVGPDGRLGAATAVVHHQGQGANPQRQEHAHAHSIRVDPTNRFIFACDLGLDQIRSYRLDLAGGTLAPNDPPAFAAAPGAGPRHLDWHPNGQLAFVIDELDNTLMSLRYDAAKGALTPIQTVGTLPADFHGRSSCADVHVHPNGRFVYGSNRGHDSLVVYAVDPDSGRLTYVQHVSSGGRTPRGFVIDPSGRWLLAANQDSDNVVVFAIDAAGGQLTTTGQSLHLPAPVCLKVKP